MSYWVCDNCGHSMLEDSDLEGHKRPMKVQGWLVCGDGTILNICSICVQVELTINRDSLYRRGYRKLFFGNMNATMETAKYGYEILPGDPYLTKIRPKESKR